MSWADGIVRTANRLSATEVVKFKEPGRYCDGLGLWLQVRDKQRKSWLYRYMLHGTPRWMGLGPVHTVSLADAREKARQCRKLVLDGVDPIGDRRTRKAAAALQAARGLSFQDCAEQYIEAHKAGWKNAKHATQWTATLSTYAYPIFGKLSVADVDQALVLKSLEPVWRTKPETAKRLRGRIQSVLDWATARGYRQGDNPARWRGHLDKLLPARSKVARVKHLAALPYAEIGAFVAKLREQEGTGARCLEFVIVTCVRTSEAIGARWSEIDLSKRLWIIPPDRMKAAREHRVPLSDRAIEILKALPREKGSDWVFIGGRAGTNLSNMAMLALLKRMARGDLTVHGFRSTFRDWAAEQTNFPRDAAELALAHAVGDKVEAAYRRGDMFEKRRKLAQAWATYCSLVPRGEVVSLRKGG